MTKLADEEASLPQPSMLIFTKYATDSRSGPCAEPFQNHYILERSARSLLALGNVTFAGTFARSFLEQPAASALVEHLRHPFRPDRSASEMQKFVKNHGFRYRHNETISTSFVESVVNQVVSKRMVKLQQMRWTKRGAHLLLQVRTRALKGDLRNTFRNWYPGLGPNQQVVQPSAA